MVMSLRVKKLFDLFWQQPFYATKLLLDKIPVKPLQLERFFILFLSKPSTLKHEVLEPFAKGL